MTQPAGTATEATTGTGTGDPASTTTPPAEGTASTDAKPKASEGLERDLHRERQKSQQLAQELEKLKNANLSDAEKVVKERDALKGENSELKKINKRQELALKLGLKWSVAKRISGDTDEEMEADAKELLKEFNNKDAGESGGSKRTETGLKPPTNDAGKTGNQSGKSDPNDLLRKAFRLGR